jgi:AcrR family transcriptional regulator
MGRRREFDPDTVLDAAVAAFWRKGFEGTSYADLVQATGVERPALYAAFGNKEALFLRALHRYSERYSSHVPAALELPTSREVAAHILKGAVELNTRYPESTGCFFINGALATSDDAEPVRRALIEARGAAEVRLRERFQRAKDEGDLPETADPSVLAAYLMAVTHGIAVQAKAGFSREVLEAVARQALATWPSPADAAGEGAPRGTASPAAVKAPG